MFAYFIRSWKFGKTDKISAHLDIIITYTNQQMTGY